MEVLVKRKTAAEIEASILATEQKLMALTRSKLTIMEKEYDLSEWITISDYSKKYNVTVARVQNWIARGIIPDGSVIVVPELNHLKLIKNQAYEARPYDARSTK
ncbi:hypothetical protein [Dyadobacter sp. NIV53]|uniref:hypothetical protein n=1 Tax=Dyadobacter sp. NIV53 TaxID=2861765 RepID=UPI001C882D55|nr:hypothetical protein [Dyadobacter sp. NIV53]